MKFTPCFEGKKNGRFFNFPWFFQGFLFPGLLSGLLIYLSLFGAFMYLCTVIQNPYDPF